MYAKQNSFNDFMLLNNSVKHLFKKTLKEQYFIDIKKQLVVNPKNYIIV